VIGLNHVASPEFQELKDEIQVEQINEALEKLGTAPLKQGVRLTDLILRPQLSFRNLEAHIPALKKELDKRVLEHQENPKSGVDALEFLDSLKSKYEL